MSENVPVRAEPYALKNKLRRIWRQFVRVMACIVVFCTTYAMILPAITMQRKTVCGVTEHTHGILCYVQLTSKTVQELTCTYESLGVHIHTAECLDEMGAPVCGYADWLVHTHDDRCGDTCTLPEISEHTHSEACYNTHAHNEACYTAVPGALLCEIHVHGDGCYDPGEPVCGLTEDAHVHESGCYAPTLTCAAAEHTHGNGCYENGEPICGVTEEGHIHEDTCYAPALSCAAAEHTHESGCYDNGEPICGLTEEAHTHGDACYTPTLLCGEGDHTHGDGCYEEELVLSCGLEEVAAENAALTCGKEEVILHSHGEDCYDAETGELVCGMTAVEAHSHTGPCFTSREIPLDDMETLTCTVTDENHLHIERCYGTWAMICGTEEHTHVESCYPAEQAFEYDCGLTEHTHGDGCYDAEGVLQCTQAPHSHAESGCQIAAEQDVAYVIQLIENIPSADEIDEKLAEFQAAGDDAGEEAYYTAVSRQVAEAYSAYKLLPDDRKSHVTNADKLLALEHIWSVTTLAVETARPTIYQINSYDRSDGNFNGNSGRAVMLHGTGTVQSILGVPDSWIFQYWYAVFVNPVTEGGRTYYKVSRIIYPGNNLLSYSPPQNGYLLLFYQDQVIPQVSVGNYVTIHFTVPASGAEKSEGYGTVSFSTAKSGIYSDAPTPIASASTDEFIELNLYDYNGNINGNYWSNNDWYPGFQWNGGAYSKPANRESYSSADLGVPNVITKRHLVDSIDFGNSLITNLRYGDGADGSYTKSVNAANVAKTSANYSDSGTLNWIYGNSTEGYTNKPIGTSTTDADYYDAMSDTLINGYPAIYDGTYLDYLFKDDTAKGAASAVTKLNTASIDGLFLHDPVTGKYHFNSRENHAEYVSGQNRFQLYNDILTPNFITYPFGNFLPLNTIADSGKATQVWAFNYAGGMRNYVERTIADLKNDAEGLGDYWVSSQDQLAAMLEEYQESWTYDGRTINGVWNSWENLSAANAMRDYFLGDSDGTGDNPSDNVGFITQDYLEKMYNIDWDVQTNFFFGMEMKMRFYQPKGGMTGQDTNKDGTPDYPMEFNFAGDDDVWVYVDDVLFLDLTGIHRHVGGKIDFVNGLVHYYELLPAGGDVSTTPYETFTFAQILAAAGKSTAGLNSKGTFADYSPHTFNFYFLERGSGSSVCRMEFNFPMLKQNTISVEKELTADANIKALGNPDFSFQVLDVDNNGNKTNKSFFSENDNVDEAGSQWAYSLYDTDGSVIQEIKVTEKNPNGSVHTLEVRNGAGQLLRKETQDANGDVIITDYPENGKVLTVDEHGVFKLKAGQRAEFTGISENWGKYFVRELIDPSVVAQYGEITVSGSASSRVDNLEVNEQTFTGIDSPIQNASNGSTSFRFNNKITSAKLGELAIKKILAPVYSGVTDKTFRFRVTLNGAPLPAGTKYTVGSAEKTVTIKDGFSYVELKKDETAVISNILAGTRFEVVEVLTSTDDYIVGYTVDGASQEGSASGVIGVDQTVAVNVTNSERGAAVKIPVIKGYYYYGTVDRVSHFNLVRVTNATDMETVGDPMTATMIVKDEMVTTDALFTLNYLEKDLDFGGGDPLVYYYRLTEDNTSLPGSTLPNYQVFVYEVTLTKTTDNVSAEITGMWSGTADVNGVPTGTLTKEEGTPTATFMNTIYGPLTVGKLVDGSDGYKQREFEFQIILNTTYRGGAPLPDTLPAVITRVTAGGTETENTTVTLSLTEENIQTRKSITVKLSHNETITINQIPYQTTWSVTEVNLPSNVEVSYVIYKGGTVVDSVSAGKPVGYILVGGDNVAKVVFTNKEIYVLPETGGPGTNSYAMVGLMLMLCSAAFLLYRFKKRGREVT